MAEAVAFQAATRARILEELAKGDAPKRLWVAVDGANKDLSPRILLRVGQGRLIEARAGEVEGPRALTRLFLAKSGIIDVEPDQAAPFPADRYPAIGSLLQEAEANAQALWALLQNVGGLEGVLVADLDELVDQLAHLPDAASAVLRLADGVRTVAAILRDSPHDEVLTARILQRLFTSGVLCFAAEQSEIGEEPERAVERDSEGGAMHQRETGWDMSSALPSRDEFEGAGVDADIRRWLVHEDVPAALLSDDLFSETFAVKENPGGSTLHRAIVRSSMPEKSPASSPVARAQVPSVPPPPPPRNDQSSPSWPRPEPTPKPLPRSEEAVDARRALAGNDVPADADGEADLDSEFENTDERGPHRVALAVGLAVLVVVGLFMALRSHKPEVLPDRDEIAFEDERISVQPETRVGAVTATRTATASKAPEAAAILIAAPSNVRPPIAGPDAPEDVRRAETLLDAGSYGEAGKLLDHLRTTRLNDPAVWVLSGQFYVDSGGRLQMAKDAADRAIQIDPKFYRAWVLKGSVMQFMGKKKMAREAYQKALDLEPDHLMSAELRSILAHL
jgi:tetratricopeptide (TPR) repeat protein